MRITSIAIAAGLLVAAGAGATWYTKEQYKQSIDDQIARFRPVYDDIGMTIGRDITQQNFFSFTDKVTFTVTQAMIDQIDPEFILDAPVSVSITNQCDLMPLFITCGSEFTMGDDPVSLAVKDKLDGFSYTMASTINALTGTMTSKFTSAPFTLNFEKGSVELKPMTLTSNTDLSDASGTFDGLWDGVTINDHIDQVTMTVDAVTVFGDVSYLEGLLYTGETGLNIKQIQVDAPASGNHINIEDMQVSTDTWQREDGRFGLRYRIKSAHFNAEGPSPATLSDTELTFSFEGMGKDAMTYLSGFKSTPDMEDPQAIASTIAMLGKNPLVMSVEKMAFVYDGAKVNADARFDIDSFDMAAIEQGTISEKIRGIINIALDENAPEAMPALAPMLEQYVELEMVEMGEAGNYKTTIEVADRQILANGKLVKQI
ncbi:DUF945 family protein [Alteromonas sp. CYL-A6]|uniref:DUF945 family protein n=1 Tax=Alteromonas nitratireducens TaxID=3390813 RepID=UPI0034C22FF5